jgi:hemoglobin
MTRHSTITDERLSDLVAHFYAKVRRDDQIGALFNDAVHDWPKHLEKLTAFWSSVMLTSGHYKGDPMGAHTKHADKIMLTMFGRWLALWRETTEEEFEFPAAQELQAKAERIAKSLKMALEYHATVNHAAVAAATATATVTAPAAPAPYKHTPVFDQDTLPKALRSEHSTKAGVWGVIRLLEGRVRLHYADKTETIQLSPERPGLVQPTQVHWVEVLGPMKMQVEFYDTAPTT